jgi:hypothetical protein
MNDPPRNEPRIKPRTHPDPPPTDTATEQRARESENGPPDSAGLPRANRSVQGQPQQPVADTTQPREAPEDADAPPRR